MQRMRLLGERKRFLHQSFVMYRSLADSDHFVHALSERWSLGNLGTSIKCILCSSCKLNLAFGRCRNAAALFALSSFQNPLPPLASLNSKWFTADLTFRDPCAKHFVR